MNLKAHVVRWHGGKKKGAVNDFADALDVTQPRVSSWFKGRTWPDEDIQPKVCKLLGITATQLAAMRPAAPKKAASDEVANLRERVEGLEAQVRFLMKVSSGQGIVSPFGREGDVIRPGASEPSAVHEHPFPSGKKSRRGS